MHYHYSQSKSQYSVFIHSLTMALEIELPEGNEEANPLREGGRPIQRTCLQRNIPMIGRSKCIMVSLVILSMTLAIVIRDR